MYENLDIYSGSCNNSNNPKYIEIISNDFKNVNFIYLKKWVLAFCYIGLISIILLSIISISYFIIDINNNVKLYLIIFLWILTLFGLIGFGSLIKASYIDFFNILSRIKIIRTNNNNIKCNIQQKIENNNDRYFIKEITTDTNMIIKSMSVIMLLTLIISVIITTTLLLT